MLGGVDGGGGAAPDNLLSVTIVRDEHGYGMKVSGDNPVYVQSVKEFGAAWRAGLRAGDRILRVDAVPVLHHTHQQVVHMIRANPTTVLTVQQNASRHKTPITAPLPVNPEKQRQLEVAKVNTVRLMIEQQQKYIRELRNELSKVPDVRKQAQLESAEQRCSVLQHEIDAILTSQADRPPAKDKTSPPSGFLSGLPRSLSNLTGQSLRHLRQARKTQDNLPSPPLLRQSSDETTKRRHGHNNTVPMVPTTCLDNSPPPLPPRSTERPPKRSVPPMSPSPPAFKPKSSSSVAASPIHNHASLVHNQSYKRHPMHQSMPAYNDSARQLQRSSHSLDGELDGPQPNSIALQMSYPLVNAPPPPLQTDNCGSVPVLHVRSQSSPEHLDHELTRSCPAPPAAEWERGTPPPGTPPPPYATNTQPCADPQRAIISMEEDEPPPPQSPSPSGGLFSNLRSVRESKARTAVLLNWLLGERRCACANLLLIITDGYRAATGVTNQTLRRWAYEIQSTFLMPNAVLQLNGVDENMANEIEHVLLNEHDKEELLRNVFRKARQKAKEELSQQLTEFQVKRQVGLGTLYGPEDAVIEKCDVDKQQEQVVVERLLCQRVSFVAGGAGGCGAGGAGGAGDGAEAHQALLAALIAAALTLHCRPASVAAAVGGSRASFLQRDKLYKQRTKQLAKQHPQPLVVRGHHLQLQALTAVGHCHHCDLVIWGLAPQAYVCTDCKLRVHRACAKAVEEGCCLDGEHHNNRISRFMERIHHAQPGQDSSDKKSKKGSSTSNFLNMERGFRRAEDEPPWDQTLTPATAQERREESDESLYESVGSHSDAAPPCDLVGVSKTASISKESLKLATDDEVDTARTRKGHRKTMSLSNPLEIVKSLGDDWFDTTKKELDKCENRKKSRESLWSEDREPILSTGKTEDKTKCNSKKKDKSQCNSKHNTAEPAKPRKTSKGSSVSSFNFLRRKKTKPVESTAEILDTGISTDELLNYTKMFLEEEKKISSLSLSQEIKPQLTESVSEDEPLTPKVTGDSSRRLSRQISRSKSKARGMSQSVKVNTLRKTHNGTRKKSNKRAVRTPLAARSRQASVVELTPVLKKKTSEIHKQASWLLSGYRGEQRRESSAEEHAAPDDATDSKESHDKDNNVRLAPGPRGVNRAESCRERDAPRRGKHRNASDPNRLTAHNHHDLETGAATAPSGSSSSSSLSSRSNESNTVAADQQASQSDWSEEEEPLTAQWADSLPPHALDSMLLGARLRKRQEVIHELIVSEGSYVRWLKVLGGVFLRPLESQPSLLPPEELRALFPNLPGVKERHSKLYADLRAARSDAPNHIVQIRPVADAMLTTLGDSGYASCLSRFCRGQRMALEALRERRRKCKELHQFLCGREQLPLCGRLQLRDLLACVWQRLTKYQLLLESIMKTVSDDAFEDDVSQEDISRLKRALEVTKEVLHSVDTAIRTAENEHRLRTIQSKLEVRIPCAGPEWDEPKRLDLTARALRMEGELSIRNDSNKKMSVLALMLEDALVLLQREGDRFVLRPIPQPSQQGLLSPHIKWDKVLFRPNAAVRNTFFLMNINGVQMHELSCNTATEYHLWVKHMQELPLAKPELKPSLTPAPAHHSSQRSTDDSGINVSRNPSDASEKSIDDKSSSAADDETDRFRASLEHSQSEQSSEREERHSIDKEDHSERGDKHKPRRRTVGRACTHSSEPAALALEPAAALTVRAPAATLTDTACTAYTHQERLRRLDEGISRALRAKSAVVAELLGIPAGSFAQFADMAVAETLGQVDVSNELRAAHLSRGSSAEDEVPEAAGADMHQLLLAAQAQANQLTAMLGQALTVGEAAAVAARAAGHCDACRARPHSHAKRTKGHHEGVDLPKTDHAGAFLASALDDSAAGAAGLNADTSLDSLRELSESLVGEPSAEHALECDHSAATLATRLVGVTCGLQGALGRLLGALPALEGERRALRAALAADRERADAARARAGYPVPEEILFSKESVDQPIRDQPSNGG